MSENMSVASIANKTLFYLLCLDITKSSVSSIGTINTSDTTKSVNAIYTEVETAARAAMNKE